jgi:cell fate (sporulation/competence/biofilm development) regulator YlbF (YheA/YmcA/DUF963 family)
MNNLEQKIKEFSQAIQETRECQVFKKAAQTYDNDKEAQKLMNDFQVAQQQLVILREGNFSGQEEPEKKYEILLKEVRANAAINEFVEARKKMEILVGDLATTVSNEIGFPFNLPPKKSCGCSS